MRSCRERVGYQATEEVVALDVMPLNRTGKIDRVGLQRWRSTTSAERSGGVTTPVTPL